MKKKKKKESCERFVILFHFILFGIFFSFDHFSEHLSGFAIRIFLTLYHPRLARTQSKHITHKPV